MKLLSIFLFLMVSCREKADIPKIGPEIKDSTPKNLGNFEINYQAGGKLYASPDMNSPVLAIAPVGELVDVFASVRTVIEPRTKRSISVILAKYGSQIGWLDEDSLIYPRQAPPKLHPFTGKISDFRLGCLTDDLYDSNDVACSNCGTLDFFPWGGFKGTLGCDEHLTGKWEVTGDSIVIKAESEVMCNHAFNHLPTEAECLKFQASTRKQRIFTLTKKEALWQLVPELRLSAQAQNYHLFSP